MRNVTMKRSSFFVLLGLLLVFATGCHKDDATFFMGLRGGDVSYREFADESPKVASVCDYIENVLLADFIERHPERTWTEVSPRLGDGITDSKAIEKYQEALQDLQKVEQEANDIIKLSLSGEKGNFLITRVLYLSCRTADHRHDGDSNLREYQFSVGYKGGGK